MSRRRGQGKDAVRCPTCGKLVRRADLEPCAHPNTAPIESRDELAIVPVWAP